MQFSFDQTAFLTSFRHCVLKCHTRLWSNAQCPKLRSLFSCLQPVLCKFNSTDSVAISALGCMSLRHKVRTKKWVWDPKMRVPSLPDARPTNVSTSNPLIGMPWKLMSQIICFKTLMHVPLRWRAIHFIVLFWRQMLGLFGCLFRRGRFAQWWLCRFFLRNKSWGSSLSSEGSLLSGGKTPRRVTFQCCSPLRQGAPTSTAVPGILVLNLSSQIGEE